MKLGISSCLFGNAVRYDGGHKLDHFLTVTFGHYVDWVPVCPEVECGLPVPREAMRLVGKPNKPRLVTIRTGVDHTNRMLRWAKKKFAELEKKDICGFVFKSRSPSSGMRGVKIYSPKGKHIGSGSGIFAKAFQDHFPLLPIEDEDRLQNPTLRENFVERIFIYQRLQKFREMDKTLNGLVAFHTSVKLLIMAHSPKHYSALGKLVADPKKYRRDELFDRYCEILMEGVKFLATTKKNTNVLQYVARYFKDRLSADEKKKMQNSITNYHRELVPLNVPLTLLQNYTRKYNIEFLKKQIYLNPHPLELMLRYHG